MIYIGALRMLWPFFVLTGCALIATRLTKLDAASRFLAYGLVGSIAGYVLAPLEGAAIGLVPSVMIEPQYFVRPFAGCISVSAVCLAGMTSIFGVLIGFFAGGYIGLRRRIRA